MATWAYIFITTRQPKKVVRAVRRIRGVVHADALFGSPDVIAIVSGRDVADMDAVIDRIALVPFVAGTDSKVARWLDGVELTVSSELGASGRAAAAGSARRARPGKSRSHR